VAVTGALLAVAVKAARAEAEAAGNSEFRLQLFLPIRAPVSGPFFWAVSARLYTS
jgi:hypothetical protein